MKDKHQLKSNYFDISAYPFLSFVTYADKFTDKPICY